MKHLYFTTLLLLASLHTAFAQQKWELGLMAQMGNFTKPMEDKTGYGDFFQEKNSVSAGTTIIFGAYAQRRISRSLALSGGLAFALSNYAAHRDANLNDPLWMRDDEWNTTITERNLLLPLTLHWFFGPSAKYSLGLGSTLSYHLNTEISVFYTERHPPASSPFSPSILECGDAYDDSNPYAPPLQLLLNACIAYRMGQNTSIGLAVMWSPKPNEGPCQRYFYPDGYFQTKSTQQTLESDQRLLLFPKSLAVSLRHNFLNTN